MSTIAEVNAKDSFAKARELVLAEAEFSPNFPKEGVTFIDLLPMLSRNANALGSIVATIADTAAAVDASVIAAIDARGFVFGSAAAQALNLPLLLLRKEGKLPPPTYSASYALEYGDAVLEVSKGVAIHGERVLIVDDILATGGTARAAKTLVEECGGQVVSYWFLGEIAPLSGRSLLLDVPTQVVVSFFKEEV